MSVHSAVFPTKILENFLSSNNTLDKGVREELIFAILFSKFYEHINGVRYNIGIPIKRDKVNERELESSNQNLEFILSTIKDEDTPIDYILVEDGVTSRRESVGKAMTFQLKRFPTKRDGADITNDLADYITRKIVRKYGKTDSALVIYTGADRSRFDLNMLTKLEIIDKYPFEMIILLSKVDNPNPRIYFEQLWPEKIRLNFSSTELLNSDIELGKFVLISESDK